MNILDVLKQRQEDQARVPAYLNSIVSKFESQAQKIRDILHGENISGKFSALIDDKVISFDVGDLQNKINDTENFIQDQISVGTDAASTAINIKTTDVIASLTSKYQETTAQATMYKELAATRLSSIVDVSSLTARIQAKLGGFQIPTAVQSLMDSLPHNATMAQWCSTIERHAKLPSEDTWDFSNYGANTGNVIVSAITQIAQTVASMFATLWKGIKLLFKGIGALVKAVTTVLRSIGEKLFTNLFVDYEYNNDGQWPSSDVPVATLQWVNLSQFLENFRQMCEIGSNGQCYLNNDWQLRNNNRRLDYHSGLVPTTYVPNAYIRSLTNPSQQAIAWFTQITNILQEYHNLTIFYNYWMLQVIVFDSGIVKLGFFPSTYTPVYGTDYSEADQTQGLSIDLMDNFDVDEDSARVYGNRLFYLNSLGRPAAWTNFCRNLPLGYDLYSTGDDLDYGWDVDFSTYNINSNLPTLNAENFYSLFYTNNAQQTDFSASKLSQVISSNQFSFDDNDLTLKRYLMNHWQDPFTDRFKIWALNWFAYMAARSIADTPEIQYGGYQKASFTYYKWFPEQDPSAHVLNINAPVIDEAYWVPYYSDASTTFMIHVQSNTERIAEWKTAIVSLIVAIIAVTVAVKIAKFKRKAALKAQVADVNYFNAADNYSSDPSKENYKLLKKARRQNNFWSSINEKLTGGESITTKVRNLFDGASESTITDDLIYSAITGADLS